MGASPARLDTILRALDLLEQVPPKAAFETIPVDQRDAAYQLVCLSLIEAKVAAQLRTAERVAANTALNAGAMHDRLGVAWPARSDDEPPEYPATWELARAYNRLCAVTADAGAYERPMLQAATTAIEAALAILNAADPHLEDTAKQLDTARARLTSVLGKLSVAATLSRRRRRDTLRVVTPARRRPPG